MTVLALRHTRRLAIRHLRALWRQPAYILITLAQPVIWLLLFSQLFRSVTHIPGFAGGSYIDYLAPGVVVLTALMSSGWTGMTFIDDMERGVMDNLLASPVWRGALNAGLLAQSAAITIVQSLVIVGIARAMGAHFRGGIAGVCAMILAAVLLGSSLAGLSNGFSLIVRQRESLIGLVTMLSLPLAFLSTLFMQRRLLPSWMQDVSRYNPVNWASESARSATAVTVDWQLVALHCALLALLAIACAALSTLAFRTYTRSL
jgi:ABC-2 type transport system permease protein